MAKSLKRPVPERQLQTCSGSRPSRLHPLAAYIRAACLPAGLALTINPAIAGPEGGKVSAGQGTISNPDTNTTLINQKTKNLSINWKSFNIAKEELVRFNQPSKTSTALNRIHDQSASQIYGSLVANGNVILINSAGVFFSPTARVNVNSLTASTLDISDDDFMSGKLTFTAVPGTEGMIVNQGVIEAATGGSVNLIGQAVKNEGMILAYAGQVNLIAGDQVTMDFDGDGLMQFTIDKEVLENAQALDAAVSNTGQIQADGGSVLLAGAVAADVFTHVVNNEGIIKAGKIENQGGVIRLVGTGSGSSLINTGTLDASANSAGEDGGTIELVADNITNTGTIDASSAQGKGGYIELVADDATTVSGSSHIVASSGGDVGGSIHVLADNKVELLDVATLDVSGLLGGGTILVGGDYQGKNPEIQNAQFTTVAHDVNILADAIQQGDGGDVIIWSDDSTVFHGSISARGGAEGGDGGFAEISGKKNLAITGHARLGAPAGEFGTLLLDPGHISVVTGADGGTMTTANTFTDGFINAQLMTGNLVLDTNNPTGGTESILFTMNVGIAWANNNTFTLNAGNNITFNTGVTINSMTGTLLINVGLDGGGGILNYNGTNISVNTITVTGGSGSDVFNMNAGTVSSISGLTGNDQFNFSGGNVSGTASGGLGDDTFNVVNAITGNLSGNTGNDSFNLSASVGGSVLGNDDSDTFNFNVGGITITGGVGSGAGEGGDDVFNVFNSVNTFTIHGGAGNNIFNLSGSVSGDVRAGNGSDQFFFNTPGISFGGVGVTGGGGNDVFNIANSITLLGTAIIGGSSGNDTYNISADVNGPGGIKSGGGTDTYNFNASVTVAGAIDGSASKDIFNIFFPINANLFGFGGNDTFNISADIVKTNLLNGGDGTDTYNFNAPVNIIGGIDGEGGNDIFNFNFTGGALTVGTTGILGGNNNDDFNFNGMSVTINTTIEGGSGTDTFDFSASNILINGLVRGDGGNDDFNFNGNTINITGGVFGDGGIDTFLIGGNVTANLSGGANNDTFTISNVLNGSISDVGGNNTYFLNTGGDVTNGISGGTGNDLFDFNGGVVSGGGVDGGGGINTLDYTGAMTTVNVVINATGTSVGFAGNTATAITGGFDNITNLDGNPTTTDTLTGRNVTNVFSLNVTDTYVSGGRTLTFSDIEDLVGGASMDTFNVVTAHTGDLSGGNGNNSYNFSATLTGMVTGGANTDTFNFNGGGVTGTVAGGAGTNTLDFSGNGGVGITINLTMVGTTTGFDGTGSVTFTDITHLTGSTVADSLSGINALSVWNITQANAGNYVSTLRTFSFSDIENLTGNNATDTFNIINTGANDGSLSGLINGGGGTMDLATFALFSGSLEVALGTTATTNTTMNTTAFTVLNIETLTGGLNSSMSTLVGADINNSWNIGTLLRTVGDADAAGTVTFTGFDNLRGGTMDDQFNISATVAGSITDPNGSNAFNLNMSGDVQNGITGGSSADAFNFNGGQVSGGGISGGAGADTLDFTGHGSAVTVTIGGAGTPNGKSGTVVGATLTGGFDGITNLVGSTMNDTLVGTAGADQFDITMPNQGCVDATVACTTTPLIFSSIENLSGAGGNDVFNINSTLNGSITDSGGSNDFNLEAGGNVTGNIIGGANTDTFDFNGGSVGGSIDGGAGMNILDFAGAAAVTVNLTAIGGTTGFDGTVAGVTITGGFDNITQVVGSAMTDSLAGLNAASTWNVSMNNQGTYSTTGTANTFAFSSIENLTGNAGNDIFNVSATLNGSITGGDGSNDFNLEAGGNVTGNIIGGANTDTFDFNGGSVGSNVDGGNGTNTLDYAGVAGGITVTLNNLGTTVGFAGTMATAITGNFDNITNLIGGGGTDTLTGRDAGGTFNITATDNYVSGARTLNFTAIEDLTGGSMADVFNITQSHTGDLRGAAGDDSYNISASLTGLIADTGGMNDYNFNAGSVTGTVTGGANTDTFDFNGGSVGGLVDGGAGTNTLDLAGAGGGHTVDVGAGTVAGGDLASFANITNFTGDDTTDKLAGGTQYLVNNVNDGTANAGAFNFVNFVELVANAAGASFTVNMTGSIATLTGSGVVDTFNLSGGVVTTINAGNGADVINLNSGTVTTVNGETGNDAFTLGAAMFTTLDGGGDAGDSLAVTAATTFNINGADDGAIAGNGNWLDIANLTGSAGNDRFDVTMATGSLSGVIDGNGGNDTADFGARTGTLNVSITAVGMTATNTFAVQDVDNITGGTDPSASTLVGPNAANVWTINSATTGTVGAVSYSAFGNLQGGSGTDTFNLTGFNNLGTMITLNIDGGTPSPTTKNPTMGDVLNINDAADGGVDTYLISVPSTGAPADGTIVKNTNITLSFADIENITLDAGIGDDAVTLNINNAFSPGTPMVINFDIDGGNEMTAVDNFTFSGYNVTMSSGGIGGVRTHLASNASDLVLRDFDMSTNLSPANITLNGSAGIDTFSVALDGAGNLTINCAACTTTLINRPINLVNQVTLNGLTGSDIFNITWDNDNPNNANGNKSPLDYLVGNLMINGGAGTGDVINLNDVGTTAFTFPTITHNLATATSGSIVIGGVNGGSIAYTTTEGPIVDNLLAQDRVFNFNATMTNQVITLANNAVAGLNQITSNVGAAQVNFLNTVGMTTASVSINGGGTTGDTFNLISLDAGFSAVVPITITGGAANDVFVIGNMTNSLDFIPNSITVNGAGGATDTLTINDSADTNAQTYVIASGTVTPRTGRNINYATVEVVNITGGTVNDVFNYTANGTLSGNIDGGGGANNSVNIANVTGAQTINLTMSTISTILGGTFTNVNSFTGDNMSDSLLSSGSFNVTNTNDGNANMTTSFTNIPNLTGDGGANTFNVSAVLTGSISDPGGTNDYNLNMSGDVQSGITGGTGIDIFDFNGGTVSGGGVDGGSGTNTLDFSGLGGPVLVNLTATGGTTGFNGSVTGAVTLTGTNTFNNINNVTATAAATDELRNSLAAGGTFTVNGVTNTFVSGNTLNFSAIEDLTGSDTGGDMFNLSGVVTHTGTLSGRGGDDTFNITGTSTLVGDANGGAGTDTFNITTGTVSGNLIGDAGNDIFNLSSATVTGNLSGDAGDDLFFLGFNVSVGGTIDGGTAAETLGDTIFGPATTTTWSVSAPNAGFIAGTANASFTNVENLVGSSFADSYTISAALSGGILDFGGTNTFNLSAGGSIGNGIIGGASTDTFIFNDTGFTIGANTMTFGGTMGLTMTTGVGIAGGSGSNTLNFGALGGPLVINLTAVGASTGFDGDVSGVTLNMFSDINNVTGSTGTDELRNSLAAGGTFTVNGVTNTFVSGNTLNFSAIEDLTGSDTGDDTFTISAAHSGDLSGRGGDDNFTLSAVLTGTIDGGTNTAVGDTVTGPTAASVFSLTNNGAGNVNGGATTNAFSNIENLVGQTGSDTFNINGFTLGGTVTGGGGTNSLNGAGSINLNGNIATSLNGGMTGGFSGIMTHTTVNTSIELTGFNGGATWTLNSTMGTVNGINFSGFDDLQGGSMTDTFFISDTDAAEVNGGAGNDIFNVSLATNASLDGETGDDDFFIAADVTGTIFGGIGNDTFNISATVTVTGGIDGEDGIDIFNISRPLTASLFGGSGNDQFIFTGTGQLIGDLDGDNRTGPAVVGTDTLDISGSAFAMTNQLSIGASPGPDDGISGTIQSTFATTFDIISNAPGFFNINTVVGGGGAIAGPNAATEWFIRDLVSTTMTTQNEGTFGVLGVGITNTFSSFSIIGGSVTDVFNFSTSGHLTGILNGGGGINTIVGNNSNNVWNITMANAGTLMDGNGTRSFTNIQNINVTSAFAGAGMTDTFTIGASGSLAGLMSGGGGTMDSADFSARVGTLNVTLGTTATAAAMTMTNTFTILDIETVTGGMTASASTLTGGNTNNMWTIGATMNTVNDADGAGTVTFTSFNNLVGGSADDTFDISNVVAGSISDPGGSNNFNLNMSGNVGGGITGGANTDTFDFNSGIVSGGGVNGGSGSNTLDYGDRGVTIAVTLTMADTVGFAGNIANDITGGFRNITNLEGNTTTTDDLSGTNSGETFTISGAGSGDINGTMTFLFSSFENLFGRGGSDTFRMNGGAVSLIDGGTPTGGTMGDALDFSLLGAGVTVNLQNLTVSSGENFTDIEFFVGSAAGTDLLIGTNAANIFNITMANAGNVAGVAGFSGFENLDGDDVGGTGNDRFIFTGTGSVSGNVDGVGGTNNQIDISGIAGANTVDLDARTITGIIGTGTFSNVLTFIGDNAADILSSSGSFNITNNNDGNVNMTTTFTNFPNLLGNAGGQTFSFIGTNARITGSVDGGGGSLLNFAAAGGAITVSLASGTSGSSSRIGSFTNFTAATGSGAADTLRGTGGNDVFNITAANAGNVAGFNFNSFENYDGRGGNDVFNVGATVTGGILGGVGNDIFNINANVGGALNGGAGTNTFNFNAGNVAGGLVSSGVDTMNFLGGNVGGAVSINGDAVWNFAAGKPLGNSITGGGILTVNSIAGPGTSYNVGVGSTGLNLPATMTGFTGHLIIGGQVLTGTPPSPSAASIGSAGFIDTFADTLTITNLIATGGNLSLLATNIIIKNNISAGGAGGAELTLVAVENPNSASGDTGTIDAPTVLVTLSAGSGFMVAGDQLLNSENMILDFNNGTIEVATGNQSNNTITFGPGSSITNAPSNGSPLFNNLLSLFTFSLNVNTIVVSNPAADLLGLEELGFIDTGLFEEDLTLFGTIGNGIALALAQCEEIEGCAPNVTEEELIELIAQLDARIEELQQRCDDGDTKACELVAEFKKLREEFVAYQAQLQEYLTSDEELDDEFEEEDLDLEAPVDTAAEIAKLGRMLESINQRITWLESLKNDPEARARLSAQTGIELTQESLDAIIEGAKSEAQFIQNQINLLQEGTEAMLDSTDKVFTAEVRDNSMNQYIAYGPSLLQLGEHANAGHNTWY